MRRRLGDHRNDRHRGRAAADHHHALAAIVEVFGPVLRMHDLACEFFHAGKVGRVAVGIVVIAGAAEQEIAGEANRLALLAALGLDRPQRIGGRPRRACHSVAKADLAVDAIGFRRFTNVAADRGAVGDRRIRQPWPKRIAEGEHVGIGADAGIAEQIPGAADGVAAFEDDERLARARRLQMIGGVDAGEPAADDDDIKMLWRHDLATLSNRRQRRVGSRRAMRDAGDKGGDLIGRGDQ